MYKTINTAATFFVLAALTFSIVAVDSNFWIVDGPNNFGLFEDCVQGQCRPHSVPTLTYVTVGFLCASIFTWCGTFVASFIKFFKDSKFMKLVVVVFAFLSVCLDVAGSVTYTVEYDEQVATTTAYWGYSYILAWSAAGAGAVGLAINLYILRLPVLVKKKPLDEEVNSVSAKVETKNNTKEVHVHLEKLKPPAESPAPKSEYNQQSTAL